MSHAIPVFILSSDDMSTSVADFDSLLSMLQIIGVITGMQYCFFYLSKRKGLIFLENGRRLVLCVSTYVCPLFEKFVVLKSTQHLQTFQTD